MNQAVRYGLWGRVCYADGIAWTKRSAAPNEWFPTIKS